MDSSVAARNRSYWAPVGLSASGTLDATLSNKYSNARFWRGFSMDCAIHEGSTPQHFWGPDAETDETRISERI